MGAAAYNRGTRLIRAQTDAASRVAINRVGRPVRSVKCSCGCTEVHVIATRKTFDGTLVRFWADGTIASKFDTFARCVPRDLQWIVAGELGLYERCEIKALVRAARKAWDKHLRAPERTRREDVLRLTRAYAAQFTARRAA